MVRVLHKSLLENKTTVGFCQVIGLTEFKKGNEMTYTITVSDHDKGTSVNV